MLTSIICALDEKRGVGKGNDLLFRIPEDFKRMKALTSGHPIVMGRKTFESLHRPEGLPNRTNIVITHTSSIINQNISVVGSLEDAIEMAKKSEGSDEIFIFGGGQIWKEAIEKDLVDRLYLTIVEGDYGADTFFPEYSGFTKVISEQTGESGGYKYKFLDLEK